MFHDPKFIKTLNTVTLVIFIVVMVISLLITLTGLVLMTDWDTLLHGTSFDYSADDPGAGWLVIGQVFGSIIGSLAVSLFAALGIVGVITDLILYLPAFIARIVYKKTGNLKAYWILMGLWLLPTLVCAMQFISEGGLILLGF